MAEGGVNDTTNINASSLLMQESQTFQFTLPIIGISIGICCVLANTVVLAFFRSKTTNVMHLVYCFLATSDLVSGGVAIFQGISVILTKYWPSLTLPLYTAFFLVGQLSFHVSAFLNVLLSVVRSITLFLPFCQVRRPWVVRSVLGYTVLWFFLILIEWIVAFKKTYILHPRGRLEILYSYPRPPGILVDMLFKAVADANKHMKANRGTIWFISLFLPYALPSLITLVSGGAQIVRIFCRVRDTTTTTGKSQERARKMSVTIILLTVVFFICNTTYVMVVITDAYIVELNDSDDLARKFLVLVTGNHLMYLSSAITPIILIARGRTMLQFLKSCLSLPVSDPKGTSSCATKV